MNAIGIILTGAVFCGLLFAWALCGAASDGDEAIGAKDGRRR